MYGYSIGAFVITVALIQAIEMDFLAFFNT